MKPTIGGQARVPLLAVMGLLIEVLAQDSLTPQATFSHGPLRPSAIPLVPPLSAGRPMYYEANVGRAPRPGDYEIAPGGGFTKHNGPGEFNFVITSGAWWLMAGDKPRLSVSLRSAGGAYAQPALLPGLGVGGQLRLAVTVGERRKWLDAFASIDAVLVPGSARWQCTDPELGVRVELEVRQFIAVYGFAATAQVSADRPVEVRLSWEYSGAQTVPGPNDRLQFTWGQYTRIFAGLAEGNGVATGNQLGCALSLSPNQPLRSRFVCVWGYADYDRQGVADALERARFRPFADPAWADRMKTNWFHHWIGKGLDPEARFRAVLADSESAVAESAAFWDRQRARVRIETPDARFDNVVNTVAAYLRMQYEYPSFLHGLYYCKAGKINCGYYGMIVSGYREEVENALEYISGTQCVKGRQRYFMPAFSLSAWAEDVDFYFVEQVWFHYCWTGDLEFLRAMWPSVRRALEHGLGASDPDGDGIMTGYYEMWNCDTYARGGRCVLQTAMAWSALRAAAEMARILRDQDHEGHGNSDQGPKPPDYAKRYAGLRARSEHTFNQQLWDKEVGAWCSAEQNGDRRPHPANHEQNYPIWRVGSLHPTEHGLGDPLRHYTAMRYIREHLHLKTADGQTAEFIELWWPVMWSHHYVANGDTAASIAAAAAAGDIDHFWPAMKSIAEIAYTSRNAALYGGNESHSQEMETLFILAVVDGLFGVKPFFGDNLLVVRPALPSAWKQAAIALEAASYRFSTDDTAVRLELETPVERKVRAELPVRQAIQAVRLNGQPVAYRIETAVNVCRVIIDAPAGRLHRFEIELDGAPPSIEGDLGLVADRQASFTVKHAAVRHVHDPQEKVREVTVSQAASDRSEVSFVPGQPGKCTVFLELESGEAVWYRPLDLEVRPAWRIVERYIPAFSPGGPAVSSPRLDATNQVLTLELENHTAADLRGPASIGVAGVTVLRDVHVPAHSVQAVAVSLSDVWDRLSPGSVPVRVEWAGGAATAEAVHWRAGAGSANGFTGRLRTFDLRPLNNVNLRYLYSPGFQWRIDYTGAGLGVDWRDPLPEKDRIGYITYNAPISQFEYGVLPEQWVCTARLEAPALPDRVSTPTGLAFLTGIDPSRRAAKPSPTPPAVEPEPAWFTVRADGSTNRWERRGDAAVMTIAGAPGASCGFATAVSFSTDACPRLRVRLAGTANARFFIQLAGPAKETVFRSEWLETPAAPETVTFNLPAGQAVDRVILYSLTKDGRGAENRFESLVFEGVDRRIEVDLQHLALKDGPPVLAPDPEDTDALALASTEPYAQLPSAATLRLPRPMRLEKLYLLTANLTKTLKCYYPGAEVVVRYDAGADQTLVLVPPYTLSCLVQHVSPRASAIPFGKIGNGAHPLNKGRDCQLAVSDLVLDPTRPVRELEFRCVASETLFVLLGLTGLEARAE